MIGYAMKRTSKPIFVHAEVYEQLANAKKEIEDIIGAEITWSAFLACMTTGIYGISQALALVFSSPQFGQIRRIGYRSDQDDVS